MNNYHWYLKQSLSYPGRQLLQPRWDPEDAGLFSLLSCPLAKEDSGDLGAAHILETLRFSWDTASSRGSTEDDLAIVAVIDGHLLKVTTFREAVVPPPMSAYEIYLGCQVEAVLFPVGEESIEEADASGGLLHTAARDTNSMAVVTHDCRVLVFTVVGDEAALPAGAGSADSKEKGNVGVRVDITGTGGTGYVARTKRHRLAGVLELAVETSKVERLTNWVWVGDEILASVTSPTSSRVLVLRVISSFFLEDNKYHSTQLVNSLFNKHSFVVI
jgi:elongator complex protein 1